MNPKKIGKALLCSLLEAQVKRLRRKNDFVIIAVAGSVGKTSTKLAIGALLASRKAVIYQEGNYNDRLTVPLVLFGQTQPGIFDIPAWFKILLANRRYLRRAYPYDIAVLELGTDKPGELFRFAYLQPNLLVLTAVAPEHMEFFGNMDAVAEEEMKPLKFSKQVLLNRDDIDAQYIPQAPHHEYGESQAADYRLVGFRQKGLQGQQLRIDLGQTNIQAPTSLLGRPGAKIVLAAAAVADILGWSPDDIKTGLAAIRPVPGRMRVLRGISGTMLIDDTYNSSPSAAKAALDVLYQQTQASQRICILGDMNELGDRSPAEHQTVGAYCDPEKLDLVVTIGAEAQKYLSPTAAHNGCQVKSFLSPYEAGAYVKRHLKPGAVILAKGSQNKIFGEEALKTLLNDPADANQMVRQSPYWLKIKQRQFPETSPD